MINISKNIGKGRINLLCYQEDKNNLDGSPMKIQEIEITDIGGIPYLKLDNLDSHMNIICGENGVGKTNILNAIAVSFTESDSHVVKKRVGSEQGLIVLNYIEAPNTSPLRFTSHVKCYEPQEGIANFRSQILPSKLAINIKVNRVFNYSVLNSIPKDPNPDYYNTNVTEGSLSEDLKQWLISRDLFNKAGYLTEEERQHNIDHATRLIRAIDDKYSFKKSTTDNEIVITTPTGDIYFEYLSSGFKSIFFILAGIIKDIEFKYGKDYIRSTEYEGVILIDEIELHLHPEWQTRIISILKKAFPQAQFFITTHSPHVIQSAQHNEIIALEKTESSREGIPFEVVERDLPDSLEYGFQGWTIEEVLEDVMGMHNTRGLAYEKYIKKFDAAIDNNSKKDAEKAYSELEKMLHPNSHVRKMLQLEMIGLE